MYVCIHTYICTYVCICRYNMYYYDKSDSTMLQASNASPAGGTSSGGDVDVDGCSSASPANAHSMRRLQGGLAHCLGLRFAMHPASAFFGSSDDVSSKGASVGVCEGFAWDRAVQYVCFVEYLHSGPEGLISRVPKRHSWVLRPLRLRWHGLGRDFA